MKRLPREARNTLLPLQHRLSRPVEQRLAQENKKIELLTSRLENRFRSKAAVSRSQFERLVASLDALSPLAILARGYSLTYSEDNNLIKSIENIHEDDKISVRLEDGSLLCDVREVLQSSD